MPASMIDTTPLVGAVVRLDPTTDADLPELFQALDDPRIYTAGYAGGPLGRPAAAAELSSWIPGPDSGKRMYTIRLVRPVPVTGGGSRPAGTVVGTSSLGDPDVVNERIHLGWTAYHPSVWGGVVNPASKLLLLDKAFGSGFGRVKIQTDAINTRSQAAIAALGATREGVLRRHVRRADGSFRDTVVFSILATEWPRLRSRLADRIDAHTR